MITAFTVKNFKAIGEEEVKIELKPITLLFGANSAGKSSILHALNYAHSVFNDYNLNAEYNTHSDSSFNLGGFSRFVHGNDLDRSVVLRFELDFNAGDIIDAIEDYLFEDTFTENGPEKLYDLIPMLDPKKLLADVTKAYVEIKISYSKINKRPYVSSYEIYLDNERIAAIYAEDYMKNVVCYLNIEHPIFIKTKKVYGISMDFIVKRCVKEIQNNAECDISNIKLVYQDALPYFNIRFSFPRKAENNTTTIRLFRSREYKNHCLDNSKKIKFGYQYLNYPDYGAIKPLNKYMFSQRTATQEQLIDSLENFLNCVLIAPGSNIAGWLQCVCYLGPLREIPPRDFTVDKLNHSFLNRWRWERGLAAWDFVQDKKFNLMNLMLNYDQPHLNGG